MRFAYTDKQITENDIKATNSICTVAIFTCFISLFYDVVILAAGDGVEVSPELVYWASFVMSTRSIVLLVVLNMTMCTSTCKIRNIFRNCGVYSHDGISYELSEIEFTRTSSLSHDENGRGCRPYL